MTSFDMKLPFLGNRTYLHGTTLFESLLALDPDATDISFKFGQLISTDRVRIQPAEEGSTIKPAASFIFRNHYRHRAHLSIFPLVCSVEIRREPFDEHLVADCAVFESNRVTLQASSPFTTVKTIVALNKRLLSQLLEPPTLGQWLFTRLEIFHYPQTFKSISVRYRARSAFVAVMSDISVDKQPIGQIMFSWWTPR